MKTKKIITLFVTLAMVFSIFAGCKADTEQPVVDAPAVEEPTTTEPPIIEAPVDTPASSGETFKITLITMDQMDQHWVAVHEGAEAKAAELGNVQIDWMAPDVKNDAEQIEKVNNAVANGSDAILVAANGPDAITSALQEADAAGVKIVYVDSPANFPAIQTLGTDNFAAGETAGKEMLKTFEEKGITEGNIGVVNVNASTASVVQREEGFRASFEGSAFTILETQYSEGDPVVSQETASALITQGVVGLYGCNEGTTVGIGNAIKEAGDDNIIGVGFDKSDVALNLVEEGHIVAIMAQNPDVMGARGVEAAVAALEGNDPTEKEVDTGVSVITKDNVADFR